MRYLICVIGIITIISSLNGCGGSAPDGGDKSTGGGGAKYKYWNSMNMSSLVEDVVKIDDDTVKFILKQPSGLFLSYLTMHFMYVVSPAALDEYGEDYGEAISRPVGTGPYKFKSWKKNNRIVLEKFDDYWGEKAKVKYVVFSSIPDNSTRLLALKTGEINGMNFPDPENLPGIKADEDLEIKSRSVLDIGYLAMNCSKEPFNDVRVRRAVNHAIDKKLLVETMYMGIAVPAKNAIPPGLAGYNDDVVDYEYNPQRARELLEEAGYPDGFKTDLWFMPVPRGYMPDGKKIAEIIQSDLKEVGIEVELITREWGVYLDATSNGEHSMCLLGWSADIADADNFFNVLLSMDLNTGERNDQNVAFYVNPELQKTLDEARRINDEDRRIKIYRKACQTVHDDAPWVPIAHTKFIVVLRKNVKDLGITLLTKLFFNTVEIGGSGRKDILIWGRGADSKGLDPGKEEDGESVIVCDNIYEPLVTYKKDEPVIVPWLATSWEVSNNGLEYTFKLRKGVKFHDGTDFNADAVVISIKRQFQ